MVKLLLVYLDEVFEMEFWYMLCAASISVHFTFLIVTEKYSVVSLRFYHTCMSLFAQETLLLGCISDQSLDPPISCVL